MRQYTRLLINRVFVCLFFESVLDREGMTAQCALKRTPLNKLVRLIFLSNSYQVTAVEACIILQLMKCSHFSLISVSDLHRAEAASSLSAVCASFISEKCIYLAVDDKSYIRI